MGKLGDAGAGDLTGGGLSTTCRRNAGQHAHEARWPVSPGFSTRMGDLLKSFVDEICPTRKYETASQPFAADFVQKGSKDMQPVGATVSFDARKLSEEVCAAEERDEAEDNFPHPRKKFLRLSVSPGGGMNDFLRSSDSISEMSVRTKT